MDLLGAFIRRLLRLDSGRVKMRTIIVCYIGTSKDVENERRSWTAKAYISGLFV